MNADYTETQINDSYLDDPNDSDFGPFICYDCGCGFHEQCKIFHCECDCNKEPLDDNE